MKSKKPTVIDLFCGCGGFSYGLIKAGFDVLLGVDNDSASLNTFRANHKGAKTLDIDLSENSAINRMKNIAEGRKIDVIVAGPPCQGFSLTGPRNFDDSRNKLYLAVFRAVKEFNPKAFLIENVPGMAVLYNGQIRAEVIRRFEKQGYNVVSDVFCAADYGVPQIRKRLFFIGLKKDLGEFEFPEYTNDKDNYVTCSDAIGDLPSREHELGSEVDEYNGPPLTKYQKMMRNGSEKLYNHVATAHTDKVKKVIALVPEGSNYKSLPPNIGNHRRFHEAWTRYHSKKPSRTIDTGHRNHFHYKYNRIPTIRENARLQSFPDEFIFYGTRTNQNRHVGNAVPPLLSFHIGRQLLKYLPGHGKGRKTKF